MNRIRELKKNTQSESKIFQGLGRSAIFFQKLLKRMPRICKALNKAGGNRQKKTVLLYDKSLYSFISVYSYQNKSKYTGVTDILSFTFKMQKYLS